MSQPATVHKSQSLNRGYLWQYHQDGLQHYGGHIDSGRPLELQVLGARAQGFL